MAGMELKGDAVLMRIKATSTMPEHYNLVSTAMRWGTTMYFFSDMFHRLNSTTGQVFAYIGDGQGTRDRF